MQFFWIFVGVFFGESRRNRKVYGFSECSNEARQVKESSGILIQSFGVAEELRFESIYMFFSSGKS